MLNTHMDLMIEFEHSFNVPHFFMFLISFLLFFSFFTAGFFSFQDKTGKMGRRNRVSRVDRKEADRLCQNVFQKNISRLHKMGREKASKNERKNWKKKKVKKDKKEKKRKRKRRRRKEIPTEIKRPTEYEKSYTWQLFLLTIPFTFSTRNFR